MPETKKSKKVEEVPKVEEIPVELPALKSDPLYEVLLWHGVEIYQCTRCPFDTRKLEEMEQHIADHERPKPTPGKTVIDRYGNVVEV